jgi:ribosome-binding protein aMBF1 (putative translation factor)
MKSSEKIFSLMRENGWSPQMVADKIDIPVDFIDMMRRGVWEPSEMEVEKFEKGFGLKEGSILPDEE